MAEVGTSYRVRAATDEAVSMIVIEPPLKRLSHYKIACKAVYEAVYGAEAYARAPQPTKRELVRATRDNGTEMPILHRVDHRVGYALEMLKELLSDQFGLDIDIAGQQQYE